MKCKKCKKELYGINFLGIAKLYSCSCDKEHATLVIQDEKSKIKKMEKK